MFLHEAAVIADEFDAVISRKKWNGAFAITPTDSPDCCVIRCTVDNETSRSPRWNPKLEDLIADDWMVTRARRS